MPDQPTLVVPGLILDPSAPVTEKPSYDVLRALCLHQMMQNVFLHRRIVQLGRFEYILQAQRADVIGLRPSDYGWIWDQLAEHKPPDLRELNGCILDENGHVVRATKSDLRAAANMGIRPEHLQKR